MPSVQIYFRDFGGEVVSTGIPINPATIQAEQEALVDAVQLWSAGENDGADVCLELEARVGNGATSPLAQSGVYAYAVMRDNINGRTYKERIPMPDLAKAVDVGSNTAWLSETDASGNSISVANQLHADYATLKSAIEDAYVSPNTNTAQLVRVYVPNRL